jgi:hypothetical protein
MATIRDAKRLLKRVYLTNLYSEPGLNITPIFSGKHGIGKSQAAKQAAKELGGIALTVEGGSLKEGEITGLPFAFKNEDGSSEVRFIPYYIVSNIMKAEKFYFNKAKKEGFLNGTIKLDDKGNLVINNSGKTTIKGSKEEILQLLEGEENRFKFGEELSPELKLKLIESGEIKPVFLFVDEMNRTEQVVMKELMNICLNKHVNGYNFPWWVQIVSAINPASQNSTYFTNQMDNAQLDRFAKFMTEGKLDEWIEHEMSKTRFESDMDFIAGVSVMETDIIQPKEKGFEDQDEMSSSYRSLSMVKLIYGTAELVNSTKFFTPDEKRLVNEDMRAMLVAKIGTTATRTLLANIENKENNIKPSEIINGKSEKIDEVIVQKLVRQKPIRRKIVASSVVNYLCETIVDFEKNRTDVNGKRAYVNYKLQIKQFTEILDDSNKVEFAKKIAMIDKTLAKDGKPLYTKISDALTKEVLEHLTNLESNLRELDKGK